MMIPLVKVKLVKPKDEDDACVGCYYHDDDSKPCPTDGNAQLLCIDKEVSEWAIWQQYDILPKLKEHVIAGKRYKQVNATMGCCGCSFYNEPNMKCKITHGYNEIANDCTNNGKIWKPVIVLKAQENKV